MSNITISELKFEDKEAFLKATVDSQFLHHPWVMPPLTSQEFDEYWRFQQPNAARQNNESYWKKTSKLPSIPLFFIQEKSRYTV